MTSRAIWIDRAQAILDELRALLQPFGVAMSSDLRVVSDAHPCPGYLHEERRIAFCPPVIESSVDRARWLFFSKMMGCSDVDEAAEFYDVALPLIVCHEASHHVRMSLAIASPSHFVEEQACDRLAVAMVRAMPNHRASLAPLRDRCARMSMRLAAGFGGAPGASFVLDVSEVLVATSVIDRASLAEIERLSARDDLPLSELLVLLPSVSSTRLVEAGEARQAAQRHVDSHYTSNAAEYWHLGLTWIGSYLDRSSEGASTAAQALADSVQSNLLCHKDERRAGEVESALLTLLADPCHRPAAAEGLIELKGEAALSPLVVLALEEDDVFETIVRSWPSDRSWHHEAITPLLVGVAPSAERAWMQLRLAAVCGLPPPPIQAHLHSASLAIESIASGHADVHIEAITDHALFFDAWEAHRRSLDELPAAYLDALINTTLDTHTRRALLRMARRSSTTSAQLLAKLALDELGDPLGPRGDDKAANDDAHALLRRLDPVWVGGLAQAMLPARGGPAWREFLDLLCVLAVPPFDPDFTTEPSLHVQLRAAAAHADLRGCLPEDNKTCRDTASELIRHAEALRSQSLAHRQREQRHDRACA